MRRILPRRFHGSPTVSHDALILFEKGSRSHSSADTKNQAGFMKVKVCEAANWSAHQLWYLKFEVRTGLLLTEAKMSVGELWCKCSISHFAFPAALGGCLLEYSTIDHGSADAGWHTALAEVICRMQAPSGRLLTEQ